MWAGLLASIISLNSIASFTWSCETLEGGEKREGGTGARRWAEGVSQQVRLVHEHAYCLSLTGWGGMLRVGN